jgi:glycerol kinase
MHSLKSAPDTQALANGQTMAAMIVNTNIDRQTAALGAAALAAVGPTFDLKSRLFEWRNQMGIYLAGIDLGTTGAKAMVFDFDGYPIAGAYREYPCIYPKPGWVEQNPDLLVEATMEAMGQAVKDSGIQSREIASISLSAQRCCGIFLDGRETLLRPMISWQDNRTPVEVEEIASLIEETDYYEKTGFLTVRSGCSTYKDL